MGVHADRVRLERDPHFWIAHIAAVVVWLAGLAWLGPQVDPLWPLHQPEAFLLLGVAYPVVEEGVFRGLLQGYLLEHQRLRAGVGGVTLANLAVSLIFTSLHFISHPPAAAAAVLVPSLVFGYFRDRHGNLVAPIWLHIFYNVGYFWLFTSGGAGS